MYAYTYMYIDYRTSKIMYIDNIDIDLSCVGSASPEPHSPGGFEDSFPRPVIFTPLMSNVTLRGESVLSKSIIIMYMYIYSGTSILWTVLIVEVSLIKG